MGEKHKQVIDQDLKVLDKNEGDACVVEENLTELNCNKESDKDTKDKEAVQKKKIDEAEQKVSKQNSKRKKILNWAFFALSIAVAIGMLVYQLYNDNNGGGGSIIGIKVYALPLIVLLFVFSLNIFLDSFACSYLMKRSVGKWRPALSYKVNSVGRYYDSVTPMATGGQPFQITYLKSHDVPLHSAMSIPLAKMVFQQLCWVVLSFVCLVVELSTQKLDSAVLIISAIGFVLSSFMLVFLAFLSISKALGRKLVVWVLKLLQKIKLVKNYEKVYQNVMKTVEDYQSVMRQYAKSPRDFIVLFITYMARLVTMYSSAYLVYCVFYGFEPNLYFEFFVMSVMLDLAVGFIPLPGGTGMTEFTFPVVFGKYFTGGTFFWGFIIWRMLNYYFYIVQGMIILCYDQFYGNRKYKWIQRRETLMEESRIFKQEQIDRFRAERSKQRKQNRNKNR